MTLNIPHFTVIYIKPSGDTPHQTKITYRFPDGQEVSCTEKNIFLTEITKEEIIEKKLYAYIPFYIARYEHELSTERNYQKALEDLAYFRDKMVELHQNRELSGDELTDLGSFVNTIVTHITDGNMIEKEATSIMGGTAYETESERIRRVAREEMQAELDEKDKILEEKDKVLEEKDKVLEEKDKALEEKDRIIAELEEVIRRAQQ